MTRALLQPWVIGPIDVPPNQHQVVFRVCSHFNQLQEVLDPFDCLLLTSRAMRRIIRWAQTVTTREIWTIMAVLVAC